MTVTFMNKKLTNYNEENFSFLNKFLKNVTPVILVIKKQFWVVKLDSEWSLAIL